MLVCVRELLVYGQQATCACNCAHPHTHTHTSVRALPIAILLRRTCCLNCTCKTCGKPPTCACVFMRMRARARVCVLNKATATQFALGVFLSWYVLCVCVLVPIGITCITSTGHLHTDTHAHAHTRMCRLSLLSLTLTHTNLWSSKNFPVERLHLPGTWDHETTRRPPLYVARDRARYRRSLNGPRLDTLGVCFELGCSVHRLVDRGLVRQPPPLSLFDDVSDAVGTRALATMEFPWNQPSPLQSPPALFRHSSWRVATKSKICLRYR